MKKLIREVLSDLSKPRKDYVPTIPAPSTKAPVINLDPKLPPPVPGDLDNQDLSTDASERVRQIDYQAQRLVEEGTMEG